MTDLIKKDLTLDSREVAEMVEKNHSHLLRDIETYKQYLGESKIGFTDFFTPSTYTSNQNKVLPNYQITKKGCEFIAHKLTGQKGTIFTATYINRFHEMEEKLHEPPKPLSPMEQLKLQYEVLDDHDNRLQTLEDTMTINYRHQQDLQNKVKSIAVTVLKGLNSNAYKDNSIRGKVFAAIWRDYKDYMGVGSYKDTPKKDVAKGFEYLEKWQPSGKLLKEVEDCNNQINIDDFN